VKIKPERNETTKIP